MANNALTPGRPVLLLTRPKDRSDAFVAMLSDEMRRGIDICMSPLLRIVPTGARVDLPISGGVIFTSAQSVPLAPAGEGRAAFCVGARTADAARRFGWDVRITAQDAAELVSALEDVEFTGRLTHLAGAHRRGAIAERLKQGGRQVDVVTLYDQELCPLSEEAQKVLSGEAPVILPLFSPRTAMQFVAQAASMKNVQVVAMSDAVAAAVREYQPARLHIVDAPNGDEMMRQVEMLLAKNTLA